MTQAIPQSEYDTKKETLIQDLQQKIAARRTSIQSKSLKGLDLQDLNTEIQSHVDSYIQLQGSTVLKLTSNNQAELEQLYHIEDGRVIGLKDSGELIPLRLSGYAGVEKKDYRDPEHYLNRTRNFIIRQDEHGNKDAKLLFYTEDIPSFLQDSRTYSPYQPESSFEHDMDRLKSSMTYEENDQIHFNQTQSDQLGEPVFFVSSSLGNVGEGDAIETVGLTKSPVIEAVKPLNVQYIIHQVASSYNSQIQAKVQQRQELLNSFSLQQGLKPSFSILAFLNTKKKDQQAIETQLIQDHRSKVEEELLSLKRDIIAQVFTILKRDLSFKQIESLNDLLMEFKQHSLFANQDEIDEIITQIVGSHFDSKKEPAKETLLQKNVTKSNNTNTHNNSPQYPQRLKRMRQIASQLTRPGRMWELVEESIRTLRPDLERVNVSDVKMILDQFLKEHTDEIMQLVPQKYRDSRLLKNKNGTINVWAAARFIQPGKLPAGLAQKIEQRFSN